MSNPSLFSLILAPVLAGLVLLLLRGLTQNPWIKRRLGLSLFFLFVASVMGLVFYYSGASRLAGLEQLIILLALILAAVVLLFNRFKGASVSEKYPSIVQDAIVIGTFALVALYWAPERLLTTSAVGALVIGLALQDTLGNLFSGLALQIEKPFFVGDWVRIAQLEGRVTEVTWRATKIRSRAGNFHVVPNTIISKDTVVNFTHPSRILRVEKRIGFGYEIHPNELKQVVLQVISDIPEILTEPAPDVLLDEYSDFAIQYRCRFWIDDFAGSEAIMDKFTTLLYYRLERAGMKIPFPIRDVRVHSNGDPTKPSAEMELDRRMDFVSKVELFSSLNLGIQRQIAQRLEAITFASGERVVQQGQKGDSMYFIDRGEVRVILEVGGGADQLAILGEGQYFGEMALLTGENRSATAQAITDVEAFILRKETFREVLLEDPEIVRCISNLMVERRSELDSRSAELAAVQVPQHAVQESFLKRVQSFFGL